MNPSSLNEQLAAQKAAYLQRAPAERVAMMEGATADLKASGIEQRALKAGDAAPAGLQLPDALGRRVALHTLWQQGPLVLVFYRGGWCPYCNLQLRAWQQQLPALQRLGASLAAISPQTPDHSLSTAQKSELAFTVLSDSELAAADAFGLSFTLAPELVALYTQLGHDLPVLNGNGRWALPVPATYVIDRHGRIVHADIEADYRQRAEPATVLDSVAAAAANDGGAR